VRLRINSRSLSRNISGVRADRPQLAKLMASCSGIADWLATCEEQAASITRLPRRRPLTRFLALPSPTLRLSLGLGGTHHSRRPQNCQKSCERLRIGDNVPGIRAHTIRDGSGLRPRIGDNIGGNAVRFGYPRGAPRPGTCSRQRRAPASPHGSFPEWPDFSATHIFVGCQIAKLFQLGPRALPGSHAVRHGGAV
jgi:hypothetical protein